MIEEEELYLVYVLRMGENHRNQYVYEFIFSDNPDEAEGDGWDDECSLGNTEPPYEEYIQKVGVLKTDKVYLDVLHEKDGLTYIDGSEGVHALAYENLDETDDEILYAPSFKRLVFHYGDSIKEVHNKLYSRDLILKFK